MPIRFDEIKYMCHKYPWLVLTNKNGFTVMMKSKTILDTSGYINTDLTTTWIHITGVTWLDYFMIKIRNYYAN